MVQAAQLIRHANFQRNISNQNIYDIGLVRVAQRINNRLYDHRVRLPLPLSPVQNGAPVTKAGERILRNLNYTSCFFLGNDRWLGIQCHWWRLHDSFAKG